MLGATTFTEGLFNVRKLQDFVPIYRRLRPIRALVDEALVRLNSLFAVMYQADILGGRPGIAFAKLLRAMLLQFLFSMRSEQRLSEQTHYNLLFCWFIGLSMGDRVWVELAPFA